MAREFTEFEFILADGETRYEMVEEFDQIATFSDMHNAIFAWSLVAVIGGYRIWGLGLNRFPYA